MSKKVAIGVAVAVAAVPLAFALGLPELWDLTKDYRVVPSSQNKACAENLSGALYAFQQEMGMPFQAEASDTQRIFDNGVITKSYGRDGARHKASFRIKATDDGCELNMYKMCKRAPGSSECTTGNYGSVSLAACTCAEK